MNSPRPICPKCQHEMERGFLPEYVQGRVGTHPIWARGRPQRSFWFGIKVPANHLRVITFRCTGCGFLESYAPGPTRQE